MRAFITGPALALVLAVPSAAPAKSAAEPRKEVIFSITTRYMYNPMPKGFAGMEYWYPLPMQDTRQQVYNLFIHAPYETEIHQDDATGNRWLYMKSGSRGGVPMQVKITYDVRRLEDRRDSTEPPAKYTATAEDKGIAERWVRPETVTEIDRSVRSRASKIVSGRKKPIEKARAIYDFVVDNMTYVSPFQEKGAGFGRLKFALDQGKGDHNDFATLFVGLCRAVGIPARTVIGLKIPPQTSSGPLMQYHTWAEFYLDGVGWIPADATDGQREAGRRDYYFGSVDEHRLAISTGRDIVLSPPQRGDPLNFLINAYWEGDGAPLPTPYVEVGFVTLPEIPGMPPEIISLPAAVPGAKPPGSFR